MRGQYFRLVMLVAALAAFGNVFLVARAQTASATTPDPSTIYQWQDVPLNQQIPISRAVFDQGGYQLYDTTGETIVVPFVNNNLYVMKFGQTSGGMYFVNDGTTPTLYLPSNGYLENATVPGAYWYPFAPNYAYSQPVYDGCAPSWNAYLSMGWYPGMTCYGGYWGYHPYLVGIRFSPMAGFYFNIFGAPYRTWSAYKTFYRGNPGQRIVLRQAASFGHYNVVRRGPTAFPIARAIAGKPGRHFTGAKHGGTKTATRSGGAFGGAKPNVGSQPGSTHNGGSSGNAPHTDGGGSHNESDHGGGGHDSGGGHNSGGGGHDSGGGGHDSGGGHSGGGGGGHSGGGHK